MQVRRERAEERDTVPSLHVAYFLTHAEADLLDWLCGAGAAEISVLAEDEGGIAGHILFLSMTAPFRALALYQWRLRKDGAARGSPSG